MGCILSESGKKKTNAMLRNLLAEQEGGKPESWGDFDLTEDDFDNAIEEVNESLSLADYEDEEGYDLYETNPETSDRDKVFDKSNVRNAFRVTEGSTYCPNKDDARPVTEESMKERMSTSSQYMSKADKALNSAGFMQSPKNDYTNEIESELCKRVNSESSRMDDIIYTKGRFTIGDKVVELTRATPTIDLTRDKDSFKSGYTETNYQNLRSYITLQVIRSFPKIYSVAVSDYALIVNNTCFMPDLVYDGITLPLDCEQYVRCGCVAPFFIWSSLIKNYKNQIKILSFDDATFLTTYVADDFGLSRKIGVSSLFRLFPNLEELYIEGKPVTRETLNSPESSEAKKKVAESKRFNGILDGFHLDVYSGTSGVRNFTMNNLRSYATNRGNKGLIRYTCGTIIRSGLAALGLTVDFGAHLIGGIGKVFKEAFTPLEPDEFN